MKESEDDSKKLKAIQCSWVGGINIIKMFIPPLEELTLLKCLYHPKKSTDLLWSSRKYHDIFTKLEQTILKLINPKLPKHFKNKEQSWNHQAPWLQRVSTTRLQWFKQHKTDTKNRHLDQKEEWMGQKSIKNRDPTNKLTHPFSINLQQISQKYTMEKNSLLSKWG